MKRGFTLIELLAVIVILAIIALIATPIVLNIINEVNESSNVVSFKNLERATKLYFANQKEVENIVFECKNGICKNGEDILDIKGKAPSEGKILIDKNGNITYEELVINGYNCYKEHDKHVCSKDKTRKIFTDSSIVINTSKESNLLDYNIYGNTDEVGEKTKNLFNYKTIYSNTSRFNITDGVLSGSNSDINSIKYYIPEELVGKQLTFSADLKIDIADGFTGAYLFASINGTKLNGQVVKVESFVSTYLTFTPTSTSDYISISYGSGLTTVYAKNIQLEVGTLTDYEPYGYKIPVRVSGKNLFDKSIPYTDFTYHVGGYRYKVIWVGVGTTVTVSLAEKHSAGSMAGYFYCRHFNAISEGEYWLYHHTIDDLCEKSVTMVSQDGYITLFMTNPAYDNLKDEVQVEIDSVGTDYEPYKELTTNIYLKEPLRCQGDKCDYIDFKNKKVVRYIEELEDGTLKLLNVPKEEKIELPEILLNKGVNNILVETLVSPSKIELEYYK